MFYKMFTNVESFFIGNPKNQREALLLEVDNFGMLGDVVQQLLGGVEPEHLERDSLLIHDLVLPLEIIQPKSVLVVEKNCPTFYGN